MSRKKNNSEEIEFIYNPDKEERDKRAAVKSRSRKIVKWMWILTITFILGIVIFFAMIYNGLIGPVADFEDFNDPTSNYASIIYSANGTEMGRFYNPSSNRIYADYEDISQHVVDALVATEDIRYEEHSGIDFRALSRVMLKTVLMGEKNAGGGSTITQQLAKQLYSAPTKGLLNRAMQKPIEWVIAVKLERFFSKEEIIKMYLNQFDFLYNAIGIQSASQIYFNKKARNLNIQEAAMLVGMVKNPSIYNPRLHPEKALERRNIVLDQMYKAGKITLAERDSISALPIELSFRKVADHKDGIAPYFREELRRYLIAKKPEKKNYPSWDQDRYRTDSTLWAQNELYGWVEKQKALGKNYDIYSSGLKIYTTIDTTMQAYAEEAVAEQMRNLQRRFNAEKKRTPEYPYSANPAELSAQARQNLISQAIKQSKRARIAKERGLSQEEMMKEFNTKFPMRLFTWNGPVDTVMTPRDSILFVKGTLRASFMAMDPRNGYVKAYVGGPDFKFFQYDMISTGKRQIGSTMKPFLYTLAMEDGLDPSSTILNTRPVLRIPGGGLWSPRSSSGGRYGQMVTLRWALTNSNNWISARLLDGLGGGGEGGALRLVKYLRQFGITSRLPAVPSLCLGPAEISLFEMVSAYSAFANEGLRVVPIFVRAIEDNKGNVIWQPTPNHTEVISRETYYNILSMLMNVVDSGTGRRLRYRYNIKAEIGGKTGTTNFNADGWFMGFTPTLVTGTWVGGDERYIHFTSTANGQGAEMALPIYGLFMNKLYKDPNLGYSQSDKFEIPDDLLVKSYSGGGGGNDSAPSQERAQQKEVTVDESIFD